MSEKLVLLALQLSLQLDDVLKVLEAVPDSGKEEKNQKKYGCRFSTAFSHNKNLQLNHHL